jgi:protein phosphatase
VFEIVWVGDSRAYHWDGEALTQVTKDHSLVQVLVDEGSITAAEARVHPQRNYVTQAIGMSDLQTMEVGRVQGRLIQGQQLLLCSDGLSGEVSDAEIAEILKLELNEKQKTYLLVQKSLDNGGTDNVTVLLVPAVTEAEKLTSTV